MTEDMVQIDRLLVAFILFVLVIIRCGCLVLFAPFFGSELFSTRVRVMLAASFSVLLVPMAARTAQIPPTMDMMGLALLAGQEFAVGLVIGFLSSFMFLGAQLAGELAGNQIGFAMANVLDPLSNIDVPIIGFIQTNVAVMLFITAKLHLVIMYIMFQSYNYVGIGGFYPDTLLRPFNGEYLGPLAIFSSYQCAQFMIVGLRMAVPVMLVMLLNSVVEGFITKTMPQMNIMVMGMPMRVVLGLFVLMTIFPATCAMLMPPGWEFNLGDMPDSPFGSLLEDLSELTKGLGGGGGG